MVVIPIVVGAPGTVLQGFEKRLEELEFKGRIDHIQITALLRSARILKRVLASGEDFLSFKLY